MNNTPTFPYEKNKPETIQAMFGNIASNYDRGNAILSMQMHKVWNAKLIKAVMPKNPNETLLDLCAGTGDIAFGYLKKVKTPQKVILLDFCQQMLDYGKVKVDHHDYLKKQEIDFIQADAQSLPFDNESINNATVAYGIRNIKDPEKCIAEAHRVLKPCGKFAILELTRPNNPLMRGLHSTYLNFVLPTVGRLITSDRNAYQYLCDSIQHFISPDHLERLLLKQGFRTTSVQPLLGGIATIIWAKK